MSTPFFRDFFLRTLSSRSRAWPVSPAEKPIRSRRMPIVWKKGPGYAAAAQVSGITAFLQSLAQEVKEWVAMTTCVSSCVRVKNRGGKRTDPNGCWPPMIDQSSLGCSQDEDLVVTQDVPGGPRRFIHFAAECASHTFAITPAPDRTRCVPITNEPFCFVRHFPDWSSGSSVRDFADRTD